MSHAVRSSPVAVVAFLLLAAVASHACGQSAAPEAPRPRWIERIPPRPPGAPTGSEFAMSTARLSGAERQQRALQELLSGNVPDFLRRAVPVALSDERRPLRARQPAGEPKVWIWVLPDYLAIGTDEDFLRIPLALEPAQTVARAWDMFLPTRKIVDAVYDQAEVRLRPRPMTPGPAMRSSEYYLRHQRLIEAERQGRRLGALTAGDKKDVVLTRQLLRHADRVAIYGWHRSEFDPIQPLSTVHGKNYADYSHGVRLVDSLARVGGRERRLDSLLTDPEAAPILSYEGQMPKALLAGRLRGRDSS